MKKNLFRSWWDNELKYHNYLIRTAAKEDKPWKIRVAVMLERLPVVTPDSPEWEEEYMMLSAFLDSYGKELPEETGFMPKDKPEDHIIETDQEMLGTFVDACNCLIL